MTLPTRYDQLTNDAGYHIVAGPQRLRVHIVCGPSPLGLWQKDEFRVGEFASVGMSHGAIYL